LPQLYGRDGDDFLVNGSAAGYQSEPSIAVLASGGFVMTWTDGSGSGADKSGEAVKAQLFDASGLKVGAEIDIASIMVGDQSSSSVSALADGGFVVTWSDESGSPDSFGVKAQMFTASGAKAGGEIAVNTVVAGYQYACEVAGLAGGGFVALWNDRSSGNDVAKAQVFDAAGAKVRGEITMTSSWGAQTPDDVVALPGGGFAVSYTNNYFSTRMQIFDASGVKTGREIVIDDGAGGRGERAQLAVTAEGIVATWESYDGSDGDMSAIKARLFGFDGLPKTDEILVNTEGRNDQSAASVTALQDGGFMVMWSSNLGYDGNLQFDIRAQMFAADGSRVGGEFAPRANDADQQTSPVAGALPSGDIVVGWFDYQTSWARGEHYDVRAQILTPAVLPITSIGLSAEPLSEAAETGSAVGTLFADGSLNADFVYEILSDSSGGAFAIQGNAIVVADQALLDFESRPLVSLTIRVTDGQGGSMEAAFDITMADAPEDLRLSWGDEEALAPMPDGEVSGALVTALPAGGHIVSHGLEGSYGGSIGLHIFDADGNPAGSPVKVGRFLKDSDHSVAVLASGEIVVSWIDDYDPNRSRVQATMIDAMGRVIDIFEVSDRRVLTPKQDSRVVALDDGGYAIVWNDAGLQAQLFDQFGTKTAPAFALTRPREEVMFEGLEAMADGGFVATWRDWSGRLQAQRLGPDFTAAGDPVEIYSPPHVEEVAIAALQPGGFAAAYLDYDSVFHNGRMNLMVQLFDATGGYQDPLQLLSGVETGRDSMPMPPHEGAFAMAGLRDGGFVVAWQDASLAGSDGDGLGIRAQFFDGSGTATGDSFLVNQVTGGAQYDVSVEVLADGSIVFGWTDQSQGYAEIKTRIFGAAPPPVYGTAEADVLSGEGGDQMLHGLAGGDTYLVDKGDIVVELAGEGYDVIVAAADWTLGDDVHVEELVAVRDLGVTFVGNIHANRLVGGDASDRLDGGGGADQLRGGRGDDLMIVDNSGDRVVEYADEGHDIVESAVSFSLAGQYVEELILTGSGDINATGNNQVNYLYGNDGANVLNGAGGWDLMRGGFGNDRYVVDDSSEDVWEDYDSGTDRVDSAVNWYLGENVENLVLTGRAAIAGHGNGGDNVIVGNSGGNLIDGGAGADRMEGKAGNDRYIVDDAGDTIFEGATEGTDIVEASVSFSLAGQYVETLRLTGGAAIDGTGNNQANSLFGNTGANKLQAAGGDDKIYGGPGNDALSGGAGLDRFIFDSALDGAANVDSIADFSSADDAIYLARSVFTTVRSGALSAAAFVQGSAAADGDDRILYDKASGQIFYDADGSGAGAALLFATVGAGTLVTAADFIAF